MDFFDHIFRSFLSSEAQNALMQFIDAGIWSQELKRRVQHYGYKYDYSSRQLAKQIAAPIPIWARELIKEIYERTMVKGGFDQVIVNEYEPGQGISAHIDHTKIFGKEVVTLSLGSPCVMEFSRPNDGKTAEVLLMPDDLLALSGAARYDWRHAIRGRMSDKWEGKLLRRSRRVSVTFRTVVL